MASAGYGFAEIYMARKLYKEKMTKTMREEQQQEQEEGKIKIKSHTTITTGSEDKASNGCFFWLSKQQRRKVSRISDSHHAAEAATKNREIISSASNFWSSQARF